LDGKNLLLLGMLINDSKTAALREKRLVLKNFNNLRTTLAEFGKFVYNVNG
jgi:hypothetical protein